MLWDRRFPQLWHQLFSPDGGKLAAIVAVKYGKWTVAVDETPWPVVFNELVTDLVFNPDGSRIAAVAKQDGIFRIVADGSVWKDAYDMAWQPVFSPDGNRLAAKVQKNGKYTVAMDDRLWSHRCDAVWDPVFSPDSQKILLKSLEDGSYYRRVIPVTDLAS